MDSNHRSTGYEPVGISWLPHPATGFYLSGHFAQDNYHNIQTIIYIVFAWHFNLQRSIAEFRRFSKGIPQFTATLSYFLFFPLFSPVFPEIYLKSGTLNHIMARCLFCGAYCEVKCGIYCEGYPGSQGEKEKEEGAEVVGCTQVGTSYICDNCLKDLKQALEIL